MEAGVRLEVVDWGGSGIPIIFLAGSGDTAHRFESFAPQFTKHRHVYGITQRITSSSSSPAPANGNYTADHLSEKRHLIYMHYMLNNRWFCQFLKEDLKTPLPRKMRLDNSARIIEVAEKGGAAIRLEDRQALEYGISMGKGSLRLSLPPEQYQELKKVRP